jgi:hypothetical protein
LTTGQPTVGELELLAEAKIAEILADAPDHRLDASGVLAHNGVFYVVFDNSRHVGRIGGRLADDSTENSLIRSERDSGAGYEDIAYDQSAGHFYVLIEALEHGGSFMAKVEELDTSFRYVSSGWLDFPLDASNKGLEGLTCLERDGQTYLLGLCEGNHCKPGAAGRRPGGGRLQVFGKGSGRWHHVGTIRLPKSLWFEDYSSVAVTQRQIAVVSQESSALWIGELAPSSWEIVGDGSIRRFPLDARGRTVYCNVEGVSWIGPDRLVAVSDRTKADTQSKRCQTKDESIHVFAIPAP